MHGEIQVKSKKGRGTIFVVKLPLGIDHLSKNEFIYKDPQAESEASSIVEERVGSESLIGHPDEEKGNYEVLLVEDNSDLRTYIINYLSVNYNVIEASDGIGGLKLAQDRIPDIILTDIMMPGMDGIELCSRIKQDERTSHIPVIMLTARTTREDKIVGLETGADDYITKPFSMEELSARIHNILEQREKLKKKFSSLLGFDFDDVVISSRDECFLKMVTGIISERQGDLDFDVGSLNEETNMSRGHLYRKLKALTGMSPSELIRRMRLETAARLLRQNNRSVTVVAFKVGFLSSSYFSKCFKEQYGKTPKEYMKLSCSPIKI